MEKPPIYSENHPLYPLIITCNVIFTTFLAVMAVVTTMIAGQSIQGELAMSDTETIWLTTLYLLGVNTIVPVGNWFANQFGVKRMYTLGVLVFTLGTTIAGLAQNFFLIAIARIIEGTGAGFIFPVGLTLIVQSLPKDKVPIGINAYIAGVFGGGLGLGLPIAGYFTQFYSWRTNFFLIIPFGLLTAFSCWLSRSKKAQIQKTPFDLWGFIFLALFIGSLLLALTLGPIRATAEGWRTWYIIAFFISAAICLSLTLFIESRHPNPIIPLKLFKDPIFSISLLAMFLLGMATFASVSVLVDYMLTGLLYEKFVTAEIASVYGIAIGVFSVIASWLIKKVFVPLLTIAGLGLLIYTYYLNNELSWLTGIDQVLWILILRGVAVGLALGPTTGLALHAVSDELKSQAATLLTFFRQVGGTYGGTLISIFAIRQTIFHAARFGEQANNQLPAYRMTFQNLYNKFPDQAQAKAAIVKNILNQAAIQGQNDAFIAFAYITGTVTVILMGLISYRIWKQRKKTSTS